MDSKDGVYNDKKDNREEEWRGKTQSRKGEHRKKCSHCDGAGTWDRKIKEQCPYCNGSGRDERNKKCKNCRHGKVEKYVSVSCDRCGGNGFIIY